MNANSIPHEYRTPLLGELDPLTRRTLSFSGALGLLVILIVLIAPARDTTVTRVEDVPERFARLILEPPRTMPAPTQAAPAPEATPETEAATPEPETVPETQPVRRAPRPTVTADRGTAGRNRARAEVTASVTDAASVARKAVEDLSASLGTSSSTTGNQAVRRSGTVSSGRSRVAEVAGDGTAGKAGGGGSTGAVSGGSIEIASVQTQGTTVGGEGQTGGRRRQAAAATGGGRTEASLLAVVRRYAPGI